MYGDSLAGAFTAFLVLVVVCSAAAGAFLFWLIPWVWAIAKPWLHAVTG